MSPTPIAAVVRQLQKMAAPDPVEASDAQLLERFREAQDEAAFGALVRRHGRMVLGVCRHVLRSREDAEDAFQATFLVLARSAASIRKATALPSWLYGVACHVASNARREASRRQTHERRARKMGHAEPDLDVAWRELQAVLAEEVRRLPEKYRAPFVLCCLEGKSKSEAATQLGWKEGTVSGRLAEARKRMQQRLTRRGLTLGAALCAGTLGAGNASALPTSLVQITLEAALDVAAGRGPGLAPARAAALADGVRRAMFATKVKFVTMLVLTLGLLAAGAGVQVRRSLASPPAAQAVAQAPERSKADRSAAEKRSAPAAADKVDVSGRVLGPDGKAFAGAEVVLPAPPWEKAGQGPRVIRARSDGDGRFSFSADRAEFTRGAALVAAAPGHGPGWVEADKVLTGEQTLKLVADAPIRGRIFDLEGRPVSGATVKVVRLQATPTEDLTPVFTAWRESPDQGLRALSRRLAHPAYAGIPASVRTGSDGRFHLTGVGRERLVVLKVEADTIEHKTLHVLCRGGADVAALTRPEGDRRMPGMDRGPPPTVYGPVFDHAARPTKPAIGLVRDRATGKPMAGVFISGRAANSWWEDYATAETDAGGRFRLVGMPKANAYRLSAYARGGKTYLPAQRSVTDSEGLRPVTVHFELVRGVLVKGRITDRATGRPVDAAIWYSPLADNKFFKDLPGNDWYRSTVQGHRTEKDGTFSLLALPGSGLIRVRAEDEAMALYTQAALDPAHKERAYRDDPYESFLSAGGAIEILAGHHAYRLIDPGPDTGTLTCDFALERGRARRGIVVGPDGRPLAGTLATGLVAVGDSAPLKDAAFTASALDLTHPRIVAFAHRDRKLVGYVRMRGDEVEPVKVKLQPSGAVTGRALDDEGNPLAGVEVRIHYREDNLRWLFELALPSVHTDRDGRFRVEGLFPGVPFGLNFKQGRRFRDPGESYRKLSIDPGQTRDFGDIRTKVYPAE
jgi:RNA polymerase sigma factor (sigma-70 family)